jgi:hypothetical protein
VPGNPPPRRESSGGEIHKNQKGFVFGRRPATEFRPRTSREGTAAEERPGVRGCARRSATTSARDVDVEPVAEPVQREFAIEIRQIAPKRHRIFERTPGPGGLLAKVARGAQRELPIAVARRAQKSALQAVQPVARGDIERRREAGH